MIQEILTLLRTFSQEEALQILKKAKENLDKKEDKRVPTSR